MAIPGTSSGNIRGPNDSVNQRFKPSKTSCRVEGKWFPGKGSGQSKTDSSRNAANQFWVIFGSGGAALLEAATVIANFKTNNYPI